MAVTGAIFSAFVLVHMVGNLKAYFGPDDFNAYAHWLRHAFHPLLPYEGLLWILRVVLLTCLVLHVGAGILLFVRGRRFRGRHRRGGLGAKRLPARTMLVSGLVILGFLVFHLLDLTLGTPGAAADGFRGATRDSSYAYQNLVASLARPWSGGVYLVTMLVLSTHLAHGLWTAAQDLGVTGRRTRTVWIALGHTVALLVALGNMSLPVAVWLGVLR
ncbi:succinate dehydrogenase cytochrome b subunit [Mariniluteicoccus endophyticus]